MIGTKTLSIAGLAVLLFMLPLQAQDRPDYRDFRLGSPLAGVLSQVHLAASNVSLVHERPALLQDLQWTTPYFVGETIEPQHDPVRQIVFSFIDDQLFRLTISYERSRTEGMTDADMIAALSGRYGSPLMPSRQTRTSSTFFDRAAPESTTPVAQWSEGDVAVVLSRSSFTGAYQLVVTSARLDALARTASAEAIRLDQREAPARDVARRKQDVDDARLTKEKARLANKEKFQP
jgi:hypothetical protein